MAGSGTRRVLVLAASALDRRALAAAVSKVDTLVLVAACASPSSARERLLREEIDVFAVDATYLEPSLLASLVEVARRAGAEVVSFEALPDAGATALRLLARLEASKEPVARERQPVARGARSAPCRVVAIGSSTGGPDALAQLIPRLPAEFSATILVAQHMPASFTPILAQRLEQRSALAIREAEDGEPLRPGTVLIAPGDFHLEVDDLGSCVHLNQNPPENSCRPSVDVLFRSAARALGAGALGIVLTGMGRDGLEGARMLRARGAEVWVQDEASSVVWGMPGLVHREGLADRMADLATLSGHLIERDRKQRASASRAEQVRKT